MHDFISHQTPSAGRFGRHSRIVAALSVAGIALAYEASAGSAAVNLFSNAGAQDWKVPAGITSVSVTLTGAKGGRGSNDGSGIGGNPGNAGRVAGILAVTPGEVLTAHVGSAGQDGSFATNSGGGAGGSYGGARGGHAGGVGASGGGGGGGGCAILFRGSTVLAAAGGAGGGGGAGGSTQWFLSDNQANRDGLSGYTGGYTSVSSGGSGADRGAGNDGGGGGGGGGGYSRGGLGGTLRKTGNNNTGGNGGSAGENFSSGLTASSASYIAVSGDASASLSFTLPSSIADVFETAATVPYRVSTIDLSGGHSLAFGLGHSPTPGEVLTLVDNMGTSAVTGTFSGLPHGSIVTATYGGDTYRFTISYTGGTGNDITLTRSAASPPVITIGQTTFADETTAQLNGTVNPNGFTTSAIFEYGPTASYGTSAPVSLRTANGTNPENVSLQLPALPIGIYHFRLTASNGEGSTSSVDGTFSIYTPSDGTPDPIYQNLNGGKLVIKTGYTGMLYDSAIDAGGRWIAGGASITGYDGIDAPSLLCLNADGSPDAAFLANLGSGFTHPYGVHINAVLIRRNGKIILGGQFNTLNGLSLPRQLVCLNADGTTDTSFTAILNKLPFSGSFGNRDLVEQPDGKILGTSGNVIRRLNADGSVDGAFGTPGSDGSVTCITLQPDGKILIGGMYGLQRINADGSADASFNAALGGNFDHDNGNISVEAIGIAPDGHIWVGGNFAKFNNQPVPGLARLNADGSLDEAALAAFGPVLAGNSPSSYIRDFLIQPDGKVVVGGGFKRVNSRYNYSKGVIRLNVDGSLDSRFSDKLGTGIGGYVFTLAVRPTGEFLAGGNFDGINGLPAKAIAQLSWSGSLSPESQTVAGTYGGAITPTSAFTTTKLSGTVTYTISPALPSGLALNASTGVITGTPRATLTAGKTYTITATGSTSGTATSTVVLSVAKAPLTIAAKNASRVYGKANPVFGITVTGLVNGDTESVISGTPSFSCPATTSSPPDAYAITPSRGTMSAINYSFTTFVPGSLSVEKAGQTLNVAPLATSVPLKDLSSVSLSATSSSGLPVTLSLDSGSAATLSGSVGDYLLTDIGQTGTVTLRASQAGNGNFSAAQDVVVSFDVTKSNQVITFSSVSDKTYGDPSFELTATSDSGLPVGFTRVSGPAELQGGTVTIIGAGTVVISASQPGNDLYNEAAPQTCSFTVAAAPQTIAFGPLSPVTYGDAPFSLAASADSGLAVTYSIVSGPAAIDGGCLIPSAAGTIIIRASQAGDANHLAAEPVECPLIVNRKVLTIAGAAALDKTADTTTVAQITGARLAGALAEDEVILLNGIAGIFPQSSPGSNLPVTTEMTLGGADAANYTLIQPVLTASITEQQTVYTHQELWRFTNFGSYDSAASGADNADPDGDGLNNLVEYALGTNPNASAVMPANLSPNGANLEYTYTRSTAAKDNGVTYQIEWSDTLEAGSWSAQQVAEEIQGTGGALETVKASVPKGSGGKRFLRLQVTGPFGNQ